jgi:hypothetical protein
MPSPGEANAVQRIQDAINTRCKEKYGNVHIQFDEIVPTEEHDFRVRYTILKGQEFITRYYGRAFFEDTVFHLTAKAI